jgi:hypothetical protein
MRRLGILAPGCSSGSLSRLDSSLCELALPAILPREVRGQEVTLVTGFLVEQLEVMSDASPSVRARSGTLVRAARDNQ